MSALHAPRGAPVPACDICKGSGFVVCDEHRPTFFSDICVDCAEGGERRCPECRGGCEECHLHEDGPCVPCAALLKRRGQSLLRLCG